MTLSSALKGRRTLPRSKYDADAGLHMVGGMAMGASVGQTGAGQSAEGGGSGLR